MEKEKRSEREEYLKGIVNNLPDSPGCYQYLNDSGTIIYVPEQYQFCSPIYAQQPLHVIDTKLSEWFLLQV